jgi:glycogen debranching enzyme
MNFAAAPQSDASPVSPFRIPAAVVVSDQGRRVLKRGDCFAVLDALGQAQADRPGAEGLFFEDTRYLSRLYKSIDGSRPVVLSSAVTEENNTLSVDLVNPDLLDGTLLRVPRATLHLLASITLGENAFFETVQISNFGAFPVRFSLAVELAADFADIFEVRGTRRARRGTMIPVEMAPEGPILGYRGLDGVVRRSHVVLDPLPQKTATTGGTWDLELAPGAKSAVSFSVHCERDGRRTLRASRASSASARDRAATRRRAEIARLSTDHAGFNEWLAASRADLDMLASDTPHGLYPYAGIPWFSTAFGRDGLITALQCLWLDPTLAAGTLRFLAATQARESDPAAEAEPGKILHETRRGEMANLGEVPFGRYYGSIDATPLFVCLAAAYHHRTGDLALIRELWPSIEAALDWMHRYGDRDGDGFLEYHHTAGKGLVNQGWKDSNDPIFHSDGSLASPPIALVEVQAYAYAAYRGAAELARALALSDRAEALDSSATLLKERFEAAFWLDDLGTYALALDGAKRPCHVRTSNAGHVLMAGLASPEHAARVTETLMSPGSFCGWGIRTVAEGEVRYSPISYHNGSVWPHDNALIGIGFGRYGQTASLLTMLSGLFDAASLFELKRLPELFCGFARRSGTGPTAYPVACAPQAWSAAAPFGMLGAALGISFAPRKSQIRFTTPVLPRQVGEIRLSNLRLDEASADLVLRRNGDNVAVSVLRRQGPVEVVLIG